jgi:hypothetical protein
MLLLLWVPTHRYVRHSLIAEAGRTHLHWLQFCCFYRYNVPMDADPTQQWRDVQVQHGSCNHSMWPLQHQKMYGRLSSHSRYA